MVRTVIPKCSRQSRTLRYSCRSTEAHGHIESVLPSFVIRSNVSRSDME
jgi:hypothetical protein